MNARSLGRPTETECSQPLQRIDLTLNQLRSINTNVPRRALELALISEGSALLLLLSVGRKHENGSDGQIAFIVLTGRGRVSH